MKIHPLTHSEELLMNILWKLNSAYMKDVMDAYPEPKPHQNTISTFMKILVELLTTISIILTFSFGAQKAHDFVKTEALKTISKGLSSTEKLSNSLTKNKF